jgi:hypothetical protein
LIGVDDSMHSEASVRSVIRAFVLAVTVTAVPAAGHAAEPECAYIEGGAGTFYVNVESGYWRLISSRGDYSSGASDQLRFRRDRGVVVDRTDIQPSPGRRAELRAEFRVNGPGTATLGGVSGGDIVIGDASVELAYCN